MLNPYLALVLGSFTDDELTANETNQEVDPHRKEDDLWIYKRHRNLKSSLYVTQC